MPIIEKGEGDSSPSDRTPGRVALASPAASPLGSRGTKHPVYDLLLTEDGRAFKADGAPVIGCPDKDGYIRIWVTTKKRRPLHALMLETFVGLRPSPRHVARHLDDDTSRNLLTNLAWGTPRDNSADRDRNGHTRRGERHYRAKLTEVQVVEIRNRARPGQHAELAREYGVSNVLIGLIVKGKIWKGVNDAR